MGLIIIFLYFLIKDKKNPLIDCQENLLENQEKQDSEKF